MRTLMPFLAAALVVTCLPVSADTTPEEAAANTAKAIAEARKAQIEAEVAEQKAKLGGDVTAPFTGGVTTNAGAGTVEAYLLSSDAINMAAHEIAKRVKAAGVTEVVLVSSSEIPTFNSLISFRVGKSVFDAAYDDAEAFWNGLAAGPPPGGPRIQAVPPVAGALLGLDALNKVLGFFRTDFAIAGMDIQLDDSMLIHAVAAELSPTKISMPIQYNRRAIDIAGTAILKDLTNLQTRKATTETRIQAAQGAYNDTDGKLQKETDPTKKKVLEDLAKKQKQALDKWKAVGSLYESIFGKLAVPDDKGNIQVVTVIKESAIDEALKCHAATGGTECKTQLLAVKAHKAGGSYYTKKNLWTALGAMPFYVAGGVVSSFVLFDAEGNVASAGVVPLHGGYRRIDKIEKRFQPSK
jgi:hypothetical protein